MKNEDAPKGTVLAKYLEPSFGGWYLQYCVAYFDNPNDYEDKRDGKGWLHEVTDRTINVVSYCELPESDQEKENPFHDIDQKKTFEIHGAYIPKLGCIGN